MPNRRRSATKRRKSRGKVPFGGTFQARYYGTCRTCLIRWEPGDYICLQPGGGYGHAVCPTPVENRPPYWAHME